jgi:hypothetical protein
MSYIIFTAEEIHGLSDGVYFRKCVNQYGIITQKSTRWTREETAEIFKRWKTLQADSGVILQFQADGRLTVVFMTDRLAWVGNTWQQLRIPTEPEGYLNVHNILHRWTFLWMIHVTSEPITILNLFADVPSNLRLCL